MCDERAHGPSDRPTNRRRFFRHAAVLGGGAALGGGVLLAANRADGPDDPKPAERAAADYPSGYRMTDHIAAYYASARL